MENTNVHNEKNPMQPKDNFATTTQVPKLLTEWKKKLDEEFQQAQSLANDFYKRQISDLNDMIFFYLHKPDTVKLALCNTENHLDLFKIVPCDSEKKWKPVRVWTCNHQIRQIDALSSKAKEKYYEACDILLRSEYGDIKRGKLFFINSEEESTSPSTIAEAVQPAAPAKRGVVVDDIEVLFSQRAHHK